MPPSTAITGSLARTSGAISRRLPRSSTLVSLPFRTASTSSKPARSNSQQPDDEPPRPAFRPGGPPESPSFIQVPRPPQSEPSPLPPPRVRGSLPVPKRVFTRREGDRKMTNGYLLQTAALPSNAASQRPADPESQTAWRRRMARDRRDNLREGLRSLWDRKQARDRTAERRAGDAFAANSLAARQPEREADRLTRPSLPSSLLSTAVAPDPLRFEKAEASAARTAELARRRRDARRDALVELYVNAGEFVVTEEQLAAKLDEVFDPEYFRREGRETGGGAGLDPEGAWDVWGTPESLDDMMNGMMRTQNYSLGPSHYAAARTVLRQKKVAEELTGGKMI